MASEVKTEFDLELTDADYDVKVHGTPEAIQFAKSADLCCVICTGYPLDLCSTACSCNATICEQCARTPRSGFKITTRVGVVPVSGKGTCPTCRKSTTLAVDATKRKQVRGLAAKCPYCPWNNTRVEWAAHCKACPGRRVKCVNHVRGCSVSIKRADMAAHTAACEYCEVKCDKCGMSLAKLRLGTHQNLACRKRQISCKRCQGTYVLEKKAEHDKTCPVVVCRFGCGEIYQRSEEDAHMHAEEFFLTHIDGLRTVLSDAEKKLQEASKKTKEAESTLAEVLEGKNKRKRRASDSDDDDDDESEAKRRRIYDMESDESDDDDEELDEEEVKELPRAPPTAPRASIRTLDDPAIPLTNVFTSIFGDQKDEKKGSSASGGSSSSASTPAASPPSAPSDPDHKECPKCGEIRIRRKVKKEGSKFYNQYIWSHSGPPYPCNFFEVARG